MEKTNIEIFSHIVYHLNTESEHKVMSGKLINMVKKSVTADLNVDEITEKSIKSNISSVISQGIADKVFGYIPEQDAVCLGKIDEIMLKRIESCVRTDSYLKQLIANKKV